MQKKSGEYEKKSTHHQVLYHSLCVVDRNKHNPHNWEHTAGQQEYLSKEERNAHINENMSERCKREGVHINANGRANVLKIWHSGLKT